MFRCALVAPRQGGGGQAGFVWQRLHVLCDERVVLNKEGYRNVWEWEKGPGVGEFELSSSEWHTRKQFNN
jgi:hypothetical protein